MQKNMICAIWAYDKVARRIVSPIVVHMMNLRPLRQFLPECAFCDKDVLMDLPAAPIPAIVVSASHVP